MKTDKTVKKRWEGDIGEAVKAMKRALVAKFTSSPTLRALLLATGEKRIEERTQAKAKIR